MSLQKEKIQLFERKEKKKKDMQMPPFTQEGK